jgi:thiol:disulfide interchange protein DsbA
MIRLPRLLHALTAALALTLALVTAQAADNLVAGRDYKLLASPQPTEQKGKVEVLEFFSFGCPHCAHYEPFVQQWRDRQPKDVYLRREHVNFVGRSDWFPYLRMAIALKSIGQLDRLAPAVFDAIHQQRIELRDEDNLYNWLQKQGVNRQQFDGAYKAFSMQASVKRAENLARDYRLEGVPTFIVAGKYQVNVQPDDPDGKKLFGIIDALVERERAAAKPAKK